MFYGGALIAAYCQIAAISGGIKMQDLSLVWFMSIQIPVSWAPHIDIDSFGYDWQHLCFLGINPSIDSMNEASNFCIGSTCSLETNRFGAILKGNDYINDQ